MPARLHCLTRSKTLLPRNTSYELPCTPVAALLQQEESIANNTHPLQEELWRVPATKSGQPCASEIYGHKAVLWSEPASRKQPIYPLHATQRSIVEQKQNRGVPCVRLPKPENYSKIAITALNKVPKVSKPRSSDFNTCTPDYLKWLVLTLLFQSDDSSLSYRSST